MHKIFYDKNKQKVWVKYAYNLLPWKSVHVWNFFILILLRRWLQLIKFKIKSSPPRRKGGLKSQNSKSSQEFPEEKMTTNYKIANQVNRSPKISWFQLENSQLSQAFPRDKLTSNHKNPNQVTPHSQHHFPKA